MHRYLDFTTTYSAVENKEIDFIYTNPSVFACIENEFGVRAIVSIMQYRATASRVRVPLSQFGGTFFTRSDRTDLVCTFLSPPPVESLRVHAGGPRLLRHAPPASLPNTDRPTALRVRPCPCPLPTLLPPIHVADHHTRLVLRRTISRTSQTSAWRASTSSAWAPGRRSGASSTPVGSPSGICPSSSSSRTTRSDRPRAPSRCSALHPHVQCSPHFDRRPCPARPAARSPQSSIVTDILARTADVGMVRTDLIEGLAGQGRVNYSDIKYLGVKNFPGFPFSSSTQLYPEWPVAAMPHVEADTIKLVAEALLAITPSSRIATIGGYATFTPPLSYLTLFKMQGACSADSLLG